MIQERCDPRDAVAVVQGGGTPEIAENDGQLEMEDVSMARCAPGCPKKTKLGSIDEYLYMAAARPRSAWHGYAGSPSAGRLTATAQVQDAAVYYSHLLLFWQCH